LFIFLLQIATSAQLMFASCMDRLVKRPLAISLAGRIQAEIRSGIFGERLPGLRILATNFGVSVPTVSDALHHLASEGVVVSGGVRSSWRVANASQKNLREGKPEPGTSHKSGQLLFLTSIALREERFGAIECYVELVEQLEPSGYEVLHRVTPFDHARAPHAAWSQLLQVTQPDMVIVLTGTPAVAQWLKLMGVRSLFIGGDAGDTGIPVLATSTSAMFSVTIRRLIEAGHHKIMVPICGRPEKFSQRCIETMKSTAAVMSPKEDRLVVVESSYSGPDVVVNLLRKHWPLHSPDAVIFIDWREFVAADSFLRARGLKVPQDVSVVILSHDSSMNWHVPALSHFDLPVRAIARIAARWVRTRKLPKATEKGLILIEPRWIEAGSVAVRTREADAVKA